MDTQALIALIEREGAQTVAGWVRQPAVPALSHGHDLTRWHVGAVAGALFFVHLDEEGNVDGEERVLAVNAPETERPKWEQLTTPTEAPIRVLLRQED